MVIKQNEYRPFSQILPTVSANGARNHVIICLPYSRQLTHGSAKGKGILCSCFHPTVMLFYIRFKE